MYFMVQHPPSSLTLVGSVRAANSFEPLPRHQSQLNAGTQATRSVTFQRTESCIGSELSRVDIDSGGNMGILQDYLNTLVQFRHWGVLELLAVVTRPNVKGFLLILAVDVPQ